MRTHFKSFLILAFAVTFLSTNAQEKSGYTFTDKIDIEVTSVKDQHRSGTCWSFASISFLEAELLRETGREYNLSEMYLVRNCYLEKADRYVRMHGKTNFGGGGLAHDLLMVWEKYGLVTEDAYPGLVIGEDGHVHGEMDGQLRAFVESLIKNRNRKLTPVWDNAFEKILDAYLGPRPSTFDVDGQTYTPREFADNMPLTPGDYVTIGSFTHQPFYEPFILEIPDNWDWNTIENVKLDEMMNVLDNALEDGYTVCWDADVSEKGFKWGSGIALIPEQDIESLDNLEQAKWSELSDNEKQAMLYDFSKPRKEQNVTPEIRQKWFDNYITTDDHLMLITGTAVDQNGNKFYKVKNSWGVGNHIYDGYFYCSEAFMRAKTIFFMVNKDAVPKPLSKKLGL